MWRNAALLKIYCIIIHRVQIMSIFVAISKDVVNVYMYLENLYSVAR